MGAKCLPDSATYEGVMQIKTVKCSDLPLPPDKPNANGKTHSSPKIEGKERLPGAKPPPSSSQTPTVTTSGPPLVTPTTAAAETRSLPGKMSHSRKQSFGNNSLKTNGSAKNGDSLSRSTSTMSSGSIASSISQLCEKYFMQPLIRSKSLPSNMGQNGSVTSRLIPYLHTRRRKGKCLRKFCMRMVGPAAACSGPVAWQLNMIAERNLGKPTPGDGTKPVRPLGFSKGNPGSEVRSSTLNSAKQGNLDQLREAVKAAPDRPPAPEQPLYNFFVCHTEEDYVPYVQKLVKKCEKEGITIFTRSYSLLWGDSQRSDTEYAISSATFGIVILSPSLLDSYRESWCEKDLDVLFDRNTSATANKTMILPIYCGGLTHQQVQTNYPFLAIQTRIVYEEQKIDGIIRQMKNVLEKRSNGSKHYRATRPIETPKETKEETLKTVSELDIELEVPSSEIGLVCTRPTSLPLKSEQPSGSACTNSVVKTEPLYRTDGVVNHCCHCGPMSSKFRGATAFTQTELDEESQLMERLHQTRVAEDDMSDSDLEQEEEGEDWEKVLGDPARLNELLPMSLCELRYDTLKQLSYMMDPLVAVGHDFTSFAAHVGFCNTYIRYLKALDIKKNSPFEEVLRVWQDSAPDTTIGDLMYLLHEIQRFDAVEKLREFYPV